MYIYNRTPFLSPSLPPAPTMRPLRVLRMMTLSAFPCGQAAESHVVYNKKCVNSDLLQSLATFVSLAETARCAGPSRCLGRRLVRARGTLWTSRRTRVLPRTCVLQWTGGLLSRRVLLPRETSCAARLPDRPLRRHCPLHPRR